MKQEQKLDLLQGLRITRTQFETITLKQGLTNGQQLGEGKCSAVILRVNSFQRNVTPSALQTVSYIYYGDATKQEFELPRGVNSEIIFCKDLSEVYVRNPFADGFASGEPSLQILIYHSDEN